MRWEGRQLARRNVSVLVDLNLQPAGNQDTSPQARLEEWGSGMRDRKGCLLSKRSENVSRCVLDFNRVAGAGRRPAKEAPECSMDHILEHRGFTPLQLPSPRRGAERDFGPA